MTDIVKEARAMLAQATPGPWEAVEGGGGPDIYADGKKWPLGTAQEMRDAELIAAAPRLLAALADECERLSAALDAMTNQAVMASGRRATIVTDDGELERLRAENAQMTVDLEAAATSIDVRRGQMRYIERMSDAWRDRALSAESSLAVTREALPSDHLLSELEESIDEWDGHTDMQKHARDWVVKVRLARLDAEKDGEKRGAVPCSIATCPGWCEVCAPGVAKEGR